MSVLVLFRSHVQWWLLPVPNVRWKCSSVPGPAGTVPRYGPAAGPLLHQLLPQHVLDRPTVWREVLSRDVPAGPAGWMQVFMLIWCTRMGWQTHMYHPLLGLSGYAKAQLHVQFVDRDISVCFALDVWSWTAGMGKERTRNPSLLMARPCAQISCSRWTQKTTLFSLSVTALMLFHNVSLPPCVQSLI